MPYPHKKLCTNELGNEHEAIYVTWENVEATLGRPHAGDPEDDLELVSKLLAAGAPQWIEDAKDWIDEDVWA